MTIVAEGALSLLTTCVPSGCFVHTFNRMNGDQLPSPEDSHFLDLNADTVY